MSDTTTNDAEIVIVGAAETARIGEVPDLSELGLHLESIDLALAQCGVNRAQVDGLAVARLRPWELAHAASIRPRWYDGTNVGGCSYLVHVRHAVAALRAGFCEIVVIAHGESGRSRVGQPPRPLEPSSLTGQFERPYGVNGPPTMFTLPVVRYMHDTGLTPEQLATVAVVQRQWASRTQRALRRTPVTVDEILASPYIAYPFHRDECCVVTDGGGALVLTTRARAADLDLQFDPVVVAGTGEALDGAGVSMIENLLEASAFRRAGADAFADAGITTSDVDHLMVYDAFAHLPIYGLEALGFVERGEAGAFIADGHTAPGGSLPMNTNGGGLSYTHTGMYGMFAMQEAVRQLQGRAEAQLEQRPETSVVLGVGSMFSAGAALVLQRAR